MKARQRGMTLIELVMVLVLIAIIAGLAGPLLAVAVDAITLHMDRVDLEEAANLALARMSREIRRLRNDESVVTATASDFEFVDVNSVQLRYRLVGNTLTRSQAGADSGLADQVQAGGLTFTYYDDDGSSIATPTVGLGTSTNIRRLAIQIAFQDGGHVVTEQVQVRPRNLRHDSERFF